MSYYFINTTKSKPRIWDKRGMKVLDCVAKIITAQRLRTPSLFNSAQLN